MYFLSFLQIDGDQQKRGATTSSSSISITNGLVTPTSPNPESHLEEPNINNNTINDNDNNDMSDTRTGQQTSTSQKSSETEIDNHISSIKKGEEGGGACPEAKAMLGQTQDKAAISSSSFEGEEKATASSPTDPGIPPTPTVTAAAVSDIVVKHASRTENCQETNGYSDPKAQQLASAANEDRDEGLKKNDKIQEETTKNANNLKQDEAITNDIVSNDGDTTFKKKKKKKKKADKAKDIQNVGSAIEAHSKNDDKIDKVDSCLEKIPIPGDKQSSKQLESTSLSSADSNHSNSLRQNIDAPQKKNVAETSRQRKRSENFEIAEKWIREREEKKSVSRTTSDSLDETKLEQLDKKNEPHQNASATTNTIKFQDERPLKGAEGKRPLDSKTTTNVTKEYYAKDISNVPNHKAATPIPDKPNDTTKENDVSKEKTSDAKPVEEDHKIDADTNDAKQAITDNAQNPENEDQDQESSDEPTWTGTVVVETQSKVTEEKSNNEPDVKYKEQVADTQVGLPISVMAKKEEPKNAVIVSQSKPPTSPHQNANNIRSLSSSDKPPTGNVTTEHHTTTTTTTTTTSTTSSNHNTTASTQNQTAVPSRFRTLLTNSTRSSGSDSYERSSTSAVASSREAGIGSNAPPRRGSIFEYHTTTPTSQSGSRAGSILRSPQDSRATSPIATTRPSSPERPSSALPPKPTIYSSTRMATVVSTPTNNKPSITSSNHGSSSWQRSQSIHRDYGGPSMSSSVPSSDCRTSDRAKSVHRDTNYMTSSMPSRKSSTPARETSTTSGSGPLPSRFARESLSPMTTTSSMRSPSHDKYRDSKSPGRITLERPSKFIQQSSNLDRPPRPPPNPLNQDRIPSRFRRAMGHQQSNHPTMSRARSLHQLNEEPIASTRQPTDLQDRIRQAKETHWRAFDDAKSHTSVNKTTSSTATSGSGSNTSGGYVSRNPGESAGDWLNRASSMRNLRASPAHEYRRL